MSKLVNIKSVIPNDSNPRFINEHKFDKLVTSIQDFPEMLEKRPIIVDENMIVLGGNMRLKACQKAGLKKVWIEQVLNWTQEQKDEFIIKDNVGFGEWDWDVLSNEWSTEKLKDWGVDVWIDENIDDFFEEEEDIEKVEENLKICLNFEEKVGNLVIEKLKEKNNNLEKAICQILNIQL